MHNLNNKKKYNSKVTAATLPVVLLIVTSLTLALMLFPAPLAAANKQACNASGGAWVQVGNNGFCLRNLEPDTCTLEPIPEPPDPDLKPQTGLCVRGS